ncbi:hypothetical protein [Neobacillus sp. PS3-40]|uniref:hypothetical protein n=1 Tax=Neobacillus sp. PS3-40 TaxID=3070679 RepID=UPI0027E0B40B|nr:hypothetical protein [Neobacillus sp. PS3-40]WML46168.1 hypothetical protein RCG20_09865 [Neobacillus sp. PS3-40]
MNQHMAQLLKFILIVILMEEEKIPFEDILSLKWSAIQFKESSLKIFTHYHQYDIKNEKLLLFFKMLYEVGHCYSDQFIFLN